MKKDTLLKSTFVVKNPVEDEKVIEKKDFREEYKKRVLASIGGSMVYMERTPHVWHGDDRKK